MRKKNYFQAIIVLSGWLCASFAHQDYLGDVYPSVIVSGDTFIVQFYNNKEDKKYISKYNKYGNPIIERQPVKEFLKQPKPKSIHFRYDPTLNPVSRDEIYWYQMVNINVPEKINNPFILVYNDKAIVDTVSIKWDKYSTGNIHSISIDKNSIFGLISKRDSKDFEFFHVNITSPDKISFKLIGEPVMIWGLFPQSSEVIKFGKFAVIVWIRKDETFIITTWDTNKNELKHTKLDGIKEWNTKPQIAFIENKMLISYHTIQGIKKGSGSKIKNVFFDFPFKE